MQPVWSNETCLVQEHLAENVQPYMQKNQMWKQKVELQTKFKS